MSYTRRTELTCTQAELTTYADKVLLANELLAVVKSSGRRDIYYGDGTTPISGLSPSVSYDELNALKTAAKTAKTAAETARDAAAGSADTASKAANMAAQKRDEVADISAAVTNLIENNVTPGTLDFYVANDGGLNIRYTETEGA